MIGKPDDAFEQEAHRVAEQVTRAPERAASSDIAVTAAPRQRPIAALQRKCACSGSAGPCMECQEEREAEHGPTLQRRASSLSEPTAAPSIVQEVLRAPGQPLDAPTRAVMGPRFGYDFSDVRIHTDAKAAESARAVNAWAYTVGRDVVFDTGQYTPQTTTGKRLLAHELTHVVQQRPQNTHFAGDRSGGARVSVNSPSAVLQRQSNGVPAEDTPAEDPEGEPSVCPPTPTGLGFIKPNPPCPKPVQDIGLKGRHFHFCKDSDVLVVESPADVKQFVASKPPDARFLVHGYSSTDGDFLYNVQLACHRANRMVGLLIDAGVPATQIETATKGPTNEFPGGPEFNRVAVVLAEVPPERRFGGFRPDPACPKAPTGLGHVDPDPACPTDVLDNFEVCRALGPARQSTECDLYNFCLDSDVFLFPETPGTVMKFARRQPAAAFFTVHGYSSIEGSSSYNFNLACHRAKRVARELMNAGVPPEQIEIASKGETAQFPGGPEFNRVVMVRATPPQIGPAPDVTADTPEQKHQTIDAAIARLNRGGYALGADAYISFWTCGRVPTVRHAVKTTRYLVEGDPGVPVINKSPGSIILGKVDALGLNTVAVSDDVFAQDDIDCVMHAITHMAFHHKVSAPDFGPGHERGTDRFDAAEFLVNLAGFSCNPDDLLLGMDDPRKDKPPPACFQAPPQTFKGTPKPGEIGAKTPRFVVEESSVATQPGTTTLVRDPARNRAFMSTSSVPFVAKATVTLHDRPQEFRNYDIGYLLTKTSDDTTVNYAGGEQVQKSLPVPIRDTDGRRPGEPWFADDAFQSGQPGSAAPFMFKLMIEEMALTFEDIGGDPKQPRGGALSTAERHSRFELWLVARRRGAPLDRFSTHFLQGTVVQFDQTLDATGPSVTGGFTSTTSLGADSDVVRFRGPISEDLSPKETTTSNVIPPCTAAFASVNLAVVATAAPVADAINIVSLPPGAQPPRIIQLACHTPVDYKPVVQISDRDPTRPAQVNRFEAGLIQNMLSSTETFTYSTGEVVNLTVPGLPMKDGASSPNFDEVFMSDGPAPAQTELTRFSRLVMQPQLRLEDKPGTGAPFDISQHPACPGKRTPGTLTSMTMRSNFRTWVAVRFNGDSNCLRALQHVDWGTNYMVTFPPPTKVSASLDVTQPAGDGSPTFVIGQPLANDMLHDDTCD